ncbi:MAG: helix-turn-helix transcriptional regulator, partial [Acidobacteriota bacterium]
WKAGDDLREIRKLLSDAPSRLALTYPEHLMVLAVMSQMLARLREAGCIARVPGWEEMRTWCVEPSGAAGRGQMVAGVDPENVRRGRPVTIDLSRLALAELRASYTDPSASLESLAGRVGVSAGHLGRVLKRGTGRGFRAHLTRLRTRHAAGLLRGRLTVKQVAIAVGYLSTGELDRHFRATFGATPSEYRLAILHSAHDLSLRTSIINSE